MRNIILFILITLTTTSFAANNLHHYTLKNGLNMYVKVDKRAPVAVFQIWYHVGGSYEVNGQTGISHLLEHMMFDGTKKYPSGQLAKIVDNNGGEINAFTARDFTAYYEELAANKMPLSFQLESDRMQHLSLTQQQFNKEIKVVREERRMRIDNNPQAETYERFNAALFVSSPYHHLTIGWMDDLYHLNVADVRHWYNTWYAPNNATIVIVGNVDPSKMQALANQYFGSIKSKTLPARPATTEIPSLGKRSVNVHLPATVSTLFMGYNAPTLNTTKNAWKVYALDVLTGVLSAGESSLLQHQLVRGSHVAASVDVDYDATARLSDAVSITGIPAKGHTVIQLRQAIEGVLQQLQNKPIDSKTLQRVKNQMIASHTYAKDSMSDQATEIGSVVSVGLPVNTLDTYISHINKVTAKQIQAVAKEFLTQNNLTETVLTPLPMTQADAKQQAHAAAMGKTLH
tara:strand:- start:88146 stop:89519 length:1374 start_codon:yes stop_codon:yes gene_type:complete